MAGPLLPRHPASDEDMTAGTSANRPVLRHAPHQKLMSPLLPPAAEAFCDRHLGLPKRDARAAVGVTQQIPQILNAPLLSCRERGPFGSANRRQSKVVCNTTHLPRLQDKCDLTSCSRQRRHHGQHTTHTQHTIQKCREDQRVVVAARRRLLSTPDLHGTACPTGRCIDYLRAHAYTIGARWHSRRPRIEGLGIMSSRTWMYQSLARHVAVPSITAYSSETQASTTLPALKTWVSPPGWRRRCLVDPMAAGSNQGVITRTPSSSHVVDREP